MVSNVILIALVSMLKFALRRDDDLNEDRDAISKSALDG
jgi:hypothetical protein